jgi:hypothetical protein
MKYRLAERLRRQGIKNPEAVAAAMSRKKHGSRRMSLLKQNKY